MKKRLLLVVLAVIAAMACTLFVGCDDNSGAGESVEKEEVTISLDKKDLVVDMYDEAELYAVVKNSDETVVWTSDNPSVATVSEGIVKGVAEGETVIRASVADKTAACNVTVVKSSELPVLKLEYSEMNLYAGDVIDFEVFAKWKNKKVENAVYEWAVKDGEDVVSVENGEENGIFTLTALKAGVAEYTVSATAVGATVYADVKFTVVMPDYSLEIKNFTATDDGYEYTLWRKTGEETPVTAETVVKRAGKEIDYAVISWESSNEAVATAENGVITGKTDGKAVITATVSGRGIEPFSTEIDLTVKEEIYRKVTYYDTDKTTVLYEESVLDGTAATYVNTAYPDTVLDFGDGYVGEYNSCEWVNAGGQDMSAALGEVTADMTVYAAYGYVVYKHYEAPKPQGDDNNTAINGAFASHNKFAKIANNKLAMMFRAYEDNTQVAFMELVNWGTPLTLECKKDVWYTFVVEFAENEPGEDGSAPAQKYYGVKAYILDEAGKIVVQGDAGTVNLFDERMWAFAKVPYTVDDSGNKVYGEFCKIDIGVQVDGTKSTLIWKNYNGEIVRTDVGLEYGAEITAPANSAEAGYTFSWGEVPETVSGNATYIETRTLNTYKVTVKYFDTVSETSYQDSTEIEFTVLNRAEKLNEVKALLPAQDVYSYVWKDGEPTELALDNYEIQINRTIGTYNVTYYGVDGEALSTEEVLHGQAARYEYSLDDVNFTEGYKKAFVNLRWVDADGKVLDKVTADESAYAKFDEIVYSSYTNSGTSNLDVMFKPLNKFAAIGADGIMVIYLRVDKKDASSFCFWKNGTEVYASQWMSYDNQWYKVELNLNNKTIQYYEPNGSKGSAVSNFEATFDDLMFSYRAGLITDIGFLNPDMVKVTYMDGETELATEYMLKGQSATKKVIKSGNDVKVFDHFEDASGNTVSLTNITEDTIVNVIYNAYTTRKINLSTYEGDESIFTITESTTELADPDICSASQVITSTQNASKWLLTDINFGEYDYCFLYMRVSKEWQNVPKLSGATDYTSNIYEKWVKIEFTKNADGTYNVVCSDGTIKENVAAGKADIFVWNGGSVCDNTIVISELFYANK